MRRLLGKENGKCNLVEGGMHTSFIWVTYGNIRILPATLRVGILRQLQIMFTGIRTAYKHLIKRCLVTVLPVDTKNYKAKLAKSNGILVDNVVHKRHNIREIAK
jgi:hypothetical protein